MGMAENQNIISIPWDYNMVMRAHKKAKQLGGIKNSILKGGGNAAGYLGEEAVASYIEAQIISCNKGTDKYNYDIWSRDKRKIEVKTKRRTVKPLDFYDVSVAKTSAHQTPELYIFVSIEFENMAKEGHRRVYRGIKNIWIVGQAEPEDYFSRAKIWRAGDIDNNNGFKTHVDMYNLPISEISPLDDSLLPQKQ
jgi:hypothetical protein